MRIAGIGTGGIGGSFGGRLARAGAPVASVARREPRAAILARGPVDLVLGPAGLRAERAA